MLIRQSIFRLSINIVTPHISLNSSRGVISEADLLCASEAEILEGLSDQKVNQGRRINIKDSSPSPTKHLILTFNCPKLPSTIKAGYLNCKIRPYIPNPLRCFKCQRFGHSQTSCRGQLTCSRCAAVGHFSTDCTLELKYINCLQPHSTDSKLCPKRKAEKQIQEIKTNKNITYIEARKLIAPPLTQSYSQAAKSSITCTSTQTDENITKIKCPPLELLQTATSNSKKNKATPIPIFSTSSSSTQTHLLRSTSTISKSQPPIPKIPISNDVPSTTIPSTSAILPTIQKEALLPIPILTSTTTSSACNSLNTSASLKTDTRLFLTTSNKFAALSTEIQQSVSLSESEATASNNEPFNTSKISKRLKRNSKNRKRRAKEQKAEIEVKMTPHTSKKSYIHYDSEDEDESLFNLWNHDARIRVKRYAGERCFKRALSNDILAEHLELWFGVRFHLIDDPMFYELRIISIATVQSISPPHLPVDGVRFFGGQKGVALQLQDARVGVGSTKDFDRCWEWLRYNVWDLVGQRLVRDPRPATSKDEILLRIQAIWKILPQVDIQNLFDSMPRRIVVLIEERGGYTKH
ncbi:uncharacterized protein TNCV_522711 [Trichonephila clavipes]|nr:uncharacterized protein TNCV_522711 [Trichonephila clavipes]